MARPGWTKWWTCGAEFPSGLIQRIISCGADVPLSAARRVPGIGEPFEHERKANSRPVKSQERQRFIVLSSGSCSQQDGGSHPISRAYVELGMDGALVVQWGNQRQSSWL
ncbi:hypothetical protein NDU88_005581 [Pleurodeles waltl]|uniref:Uncharacterized protein n=1 Tax=Pleurodeles waltl TaxID=8319 RepID=A0AAV7QF58_PLEWA|nr:hypothetical protein NDU88_005581 [Pleurodeles waltl]